MTAIEKQNDVMSIEEEKMEEQKWSNEACRGYCIAAMQLAGYGHSEIEVVLEELEEELKRKNLKEAEAFSTSF